MSPDLFSAFHKPRVDFQDDFKESSARARSDERSFLGAMYANTQEHITKMGLSPNTKIKLFRGMDMDFPPESGTVFKYEGNTIESWSVDSEIANGFGNTTISMWVPLKNIVGTARTGFGCLHEGEFVILGSIEGNEGEVEQREEYEEW